MMHCQVTIAAYASLTIALAVWDEMDGSSEDLVDAALAEGNASTIQAVHRHARTTYAKGGIALAVIGVLRPASIVSGAAAGGVGGKVLAVIGGGVSRRDQARLGEVLDTGPIALVTVTTMPTTAMTYSAPRDTDDWATAASTIQVGDLHNAVDADSLEALPGEPVTDRPRSNRGA